MPEDTKPDEQEYTDPETGKPIIYADNVPELLRRRAPLSRNELEIGRELDEMSHVDRVRLGADEWNFWVAFLREKWITEEDRETHFYVRLKNEADEGFFDYEIDLSDVEAMSGYEAHELSFEGYVFPSYTIFDGAFFPKNVRFFKSIFCQGVSFLSAEFIGNFYFEDVHVNGDAIFSKAFFNFDVKFNKSSVSGPSHFDEAFFKGNASFESVSFGNKVRMQKAVLLNGLEWRNVRHEGAADFRYSQFLDKSCFTGTCFAGHVNFDYVWFGKVSDTPELSRDSSLDFDCYTDYQNKTVNYQSLTIPDFTGAHFDVPPNLGYTYVARLPAAPKNVVVRSRNETQPNAKKRKISRMLKAYRHKAALFQRLKIKYSKIRYPLKFVLDSQASAKLRRLQELAAAGHHSFKEKQFFRAELLCRRGHEARGLEILMINMFELFSKCGLSFLRPIGWWAGFAVVFGVLYRFMSPRYDLYGHWQDLVGFTVANSLPLVGIFQSGDSRAASILYGAGGLPFEVGLVAGLHTLISTILLFFALLAIRNYFKLG